LLFYIFAYPGKVNEDNPFYQPSTIMQIIPELNDFAQISTPHP